MYVWHAYCLTYITSTAHWRCICWTIHPGWSGQDRTGREGQRCTGKREEGSMYHLDYAEGVSSCYDEWWSRRKRSSPVNPRGKKIDRGTYLVHCHFHFSLSERGLFISFCTSSSKTNHVDPSYYSIDIAYLCLAIFVLRRYLRSYLLVISLLMFSGNEMQLGCVSPWCFLTMRCS
jgi:hypothetical protein